MLIVNLTCFSFVVSVLIFVFFVLLCQNTNSTFKKRFLTIWLSIIIVCISVILMFWIGLPNRAFSEVFEYIDGSIGYAVIACLSALVSIFDGFISLKCKYNKEKQLKKR